MLLATIGPRWLWHPLGVCVHGPNYDACRSYNFFSGSGSDLQEVAIIFSVIAAIIAIWRFYKRIRPQIECHTEGCRKLGLHHVAGTHFRTCWEHHPVLSDHPHHQVPLDVIRRAHRDRTDRPRSGVANL
jgi:hypothetical protein